MVVYKSDIKRRYRDGTSSSVESLPKRAKVHAQRKFAHGLSSPSVTEKTFVKEKEKVKPNGEPRALLPADRPKTEDFLTFLCFRGTSVLPRRLDFFNVSGSENSTAFDQSSPNQSSMELLKSKKAKVRGKHSAVKIHPNKFKGKTQGKAAAATQSPPAASTITIQRRSGAVGRPERSRRKQVNKRAQRSVSRRLINSAIHRRMVEKRLRGGLRSAGRLPAGSEVGLSVFRRPRSSSSGQTVVTYPVRKSAIPLGDSSDDEEEEEEEEEEDDEEEEEQDQVKRVKKELTDSKATSSKGASSLTRKDIKEQTVHPRTRTRSSSLKSQPSPSHSVKRLPSRKTKEAAAAYMELLSKSLRSQEAESDSYDEQQDPALLEKAEEEKLVSRRRLMKLKKVIPKKVMPGRSLKDRSLKRTPLVTTAQRKIVGRNLRTRRVEELVMRGTRTRTGESSSGTSPTRPRRGRSKEMAEAEESDEEEVERIVDPPKRMSARREAAKSRDEATTRRSRRSQKEPPEPEDKETPETEVVLKKQTRRPPPPSPPVKVVQESTGSRRASKTDSSKNIDWKSSASSSRSIEMRKVDSEMEVDVSDSPGRQAPRRASARKEDKSEGSPANIRKSSRRDEDKDIKSSPTRGKQLGKTVSKNSKDEVTTELGKTNAKQTKGNTRKSKSEESVESDYKVLQTRSLRNSSVSEKVSLGKEDLKITGKKRDDNITASKKTANGNHQEEKQETERESNSAKKTEPLETVDKVKRNSKQSPTRQPVRENRRSLVKKVEGSENSVASEDEKPKRSTRSKPDPVSDNTNIKEDETKISKSSKKHTDTTTPTVLEENKHKALSKNKTLPKSDETNETSVKSKSTKGSSELKMKPSVRKKGVNVTHSDEEINSKDAPKKKFKQSLDSQEETIDSKPIPVKKLTKDPPEKTAKDKKDTNKKSTEKSNVEKNEIKVEVKKKEPDSAASSSIESRAASDVNIGPPVAFNSREGSMEEKELKGFDEVNAKEIENKVDKFIEHMILKTSDDEGKPKMRSSKSKQTCSPEDEVPTKNVEVSVTSKPNETDNKVVKVKNSDTGKKSTENLSSKISSDSLSLTDVSNSEILQQATLKGKRKSKNDSKDDSSKSEIQSRNESDPAKKSPALSKEGSSSVTNEVAKKSIRRNSRQVQHPSEKNVEAPSLNNEKPFVKKVEEAKSIEISSSRRVSASSRVSSETVTTECKVLVNNADSLKVAGKSGEQHVSDVGDKSTSPKVSSNNKGRLRSRVATQAKKMVLKSDSSDLDDEPLSKRELKVRSVKKKVGPRRESKVRPKRGTREVKPLNTGQVTLRMSRARVAKHSSSSFYYETDSSSHFSSSEEEILIKKPEPVNKGRQSPKIKNDTKETPKVMPSSSAQLKMLDTPISTKPTVSDDKKLIDIPEDLIDFKSDFDQNDSLIYPVLKDARTRDEVITPEVVRNIVNIDIKPNLPKVSQLTPSSTVTISPKAIIPEVVEVTMPHKMCESLSMYEEACGSMELLASVAEDISKMSSASLTISKMNSPLSDIGSSLQGVSTMNILPAATPSQSLIINKMNSSRSFTPSARLSSSTAPLAASLSRQTAVNSFHPVSPKLNASLIQPRVSSPHLTPKISSSVTLSSSQLIIPKISQSVVKTVDTSHSISSAVNSSSSCSSFSSPHMPPRVSSSSSCGPIQTTTSLSHSSMTQSSSVKHSVSSSSSLLEPKVAPSLPGEQSKPTVSPTDSQDEVKPKPKTSSIGETWIQAFKKAKIPKPGQLSPISHSVKPFVRKPFISQPFASKQQSPMKCDTPEVKLKPFDRSSLVKPKPPQINVSQKESDSQSPFKTCSDSAAIPLVKPLTSSLAKEVAVSKSLTLTVTSPSIPTIEIKREQNIETILKRPALSKNEGSKIAQETFRPVQLIKTESKSHHTIEIPRVSDTSRSSELNRSREATGGKHQNLPLAVEHTLRKMSPVAVSRKPASSSVTLKPQQSSSQDIKEPNIFDQSRSNRSSPASSKSSWLWKPDKYLTESMVTKPSDLEIMTKKKVNMTVEEIEKWLDDSTSSGIEHSKDCGLFEKNQCECSFRTGGSSMHNSGTALSEHGTKVGRSIVEPPMQLKDIEPKCTAETISTCKVEDYKEKLISKTPACSSKETKVEPKKETQTGRYKQPTPTKQEKAWKSTRSMTEEEMCEFDFRFERSSNSPRESGSEMSSPTPKDEMSSSNDEGIGSHQSEKKTIFQKKSRPVSKSPCAFNAENESSVYAFQPDSEQPLSKPMFRRKNKPGVEEGGRSTSIAVQVNLEQESVLECSTQTDHEEEEGGGTTFYFPLRGNKSVEPQQMIQGLTVKLDADPDGQEHRVTLRAKLVSKPADFPRPTPSSRSLVGRCAGKSGKPEQKVRPLSVSHCEPPVGTVQPTPRPPVDQLPSTSQESFTTSTSSKSSQCTQFSGTTPVKTSTDNKATSPLQSNSKSDFPTNRGEKEKGFPKVGMTPRLVEAPAFYPTEKEFADPLEYLQKITPEAQQYGICRIVPPPSFKPECKVSDDMRFTSYNQYVHKMMKRWGPNVKELTAIKKYLATQSIALKHPPWMGGMEVDLPRLYQTVQQCGGLKEVIEKKRWTKVADIMKIPKSAQDRVTKLDDIYCKYLLPYDTLSHDERCKLLEQVEHDWEERERRLELGGSTSNSDDSDSDCDDGMLECITKGRSMALSQFYRIARNTLWTWFGSEGSPPKPEQVENEYWQHVQERVSHVCVHSGSIDCGTWGYGFPTAKTSSTSKHPWNLKVLTNHPQSVLRSLPPLIGVTVPTLHVGMLFSTFCWYRDPHGLPWIEYLHTGANKIWYGVPDEWTNELRGAIKSVLPSIVRESAVWLPSDTAMIPPQLLLDKGVSLCRTVQQPGQFIVIFAKAYTSAICTGYLVSESVYYAPSSWLATAPHLFKETQESCEPTMFSLEKLLFFIANDTRSSLDILVQICPMVESVREREVKERKELEKLGLSTTEKLAKPSKRSNCCQHQEYECNNCRATLFLSLVNHSNEDVNYCLADAVDLLTKDSTQLKYCKLLYLYDEEEMEELVEKIKAKIDQKSQKKSSKACLNSGASNSSKT